MPDLWFAVGLAMGIVVIGFLSVGSFDRGVASVRRAMLSTELVARHRAVLARRPHAHDASVEDGRDRLRA